MEVAEDRIVKKLVTTAVLGYDWHGIVAAATSCLVRLVYH
jgi:hypothetical protein